MQHCIFTGLNDIRNTIVMLRGSDNMVFQVRVGSKDDKRYKGTLPRLSRNVRINQTQPGLCWQEVKDVIDDITNHRGAEMVFLAMNSMDISEEAKILSMIMTHLSRDLKKMKSIVDDI